MSETARSTRRTAREQLEVLRKALAKQRAQEDQQIAVLIAQPSLDELISDLEPNEPISAAVKEPKVIEVELQESVVRDYQTPTQIEWDAYLCRLKKLPSVKLTSRDGSFSKEWDNLYDYYADQLAVNSSVDTLAKIEYCRARAILIEFAQLLDQAIAAQKSFWNFQRDPEELRLLTALRSAL